MTDNKQVLWSAGLDDDKSVEVVRLDERHGLLTVKEKATGKEIFSQHVLLSYGAAFGPDAGDIMAWQEIVCSRIPDPKEKL